MRWRSWKNFLIIDTTVRYGGHNQMGVDGWLSLSSDGSGCRNSIAPKLQPPPLSLPCPMGVRLFVEQFMVDVPCTTFRTHEDNAILAAVERDRGAWHGRG